MVCTIVHSFILPLSHIALKCGSLPSMSPSSTLCFCCESMTALRSLPKSIEEQSASFSLIQASSSSTCNKNSHNAWDSFNLYKIIHGIIIIMIMIISTFSFWSLLAEHSWTLSQAASNFDCLSLMALVSG